MRKIVLAAVFAIVSGITGASFAPVAYAQAGTCTNVDPLTRQCKSWDTYGTSRSGSVCSSVNHKGECTIWNSAGSLYSGRTCSSVDFYTKACRSWN
jgi:hypothetical protein